MQMTRELKKRFGTIDDRLDKIEKQKPVQRTNGEAYEDPIPQIDAHHQRLDSIESALIIPGPEGHISGWRDQVQKILTKLEDRILQVELRGAWTPDEARTLDGRVKNLWERPSIETLKVFLKATDDRVSKLEQAVEPLFNVGKWIDKTEERLHELEQIPDPASDSNPTVFGKPLVDWITDAAHRIGELERKPVAGTLSNIAQGITEDIEGVNREVTEVRSLVRRTTRWFLVFSSIVFLLLGLTFYLL